MPETLKRANVKVKVDGQFQDLGLLQSDVATQLADEIAERKSNDNSLEANKIPYPINPHSKYGNPGDVLRTDGNGHTTWVPVGQPTDEQTQDAINNWLNEHPEATTTVEDESLTYKKLIPGTLGFVTPEMFGAIGDGINDDSLAFQNAIDSGKPILLNNSYLIKNCKLISNTMILGKGTIIQNSNSISEKIFDTEDEDDITIIGITITSGTASESTATEGCLRFVNCKNITISDVVINNNSARLFVFDGCNNVLCSNFIAEENFGTVFTATNSNHVKYEKGYITASQNPYNAHCLDIYARANFTVVGASARNIFIKGDRNVNLSPIIDGVLSGIQFTANQAGNGKFEHFEMKDNTAVNCIGGFKQDGLNNCYFENCKCYNCGGGCITRGISATQCDSAIFKNCYAGSQSDKLSNTTGLYSVLDGTKLVILDGCEIENYLRPFRTNQNIEHIIIKNCYIHSLGSLRFYDDTADSSNNPEYFNIIEFVNNNVDYVGSLFVNGSKFYPFTPCSKLIMKSNTFKLGTSGTTRMFGFAVLDDVQFENNSFNATMSNLFYVSKPAKMSLSANKCIVTNIGNVRERHGSGQYTVDLMELDTTDISNIIKIIEMQVKST